MKKNALSAQVLGRAWVGPLLAVVAVVALFAFVTPGNFLSPVNLGTMARQTVVVAIAAAGMTLVVIKGGIDLSVGSSVALTTVVIARSLQAGHGTIVSCLIGIATAVGAGCINGALVARLRITPFIVTLGTMSMLRGSAKGFADEQKIDADVGGLAAWMAEVPSQRAWQLLPLGVWLAIAVTVAAAGLLHFTRFGRHLVAVGSNAETARLCGISVPWTTFLAYAIAGLTAGLAGTMELSTLTVGDPTDSIGLELSVIASVVIGGGSLSGGRGSLFGSMLGAILMTVIRTGCTYVGYPNWVQEILTGGIIVVAVALDGLRQRARG